MSTLEGQAFRCVSSGPEPERFDQWVTVFQTTDGKITVQVMTTGIEPAYKVGDRYRLDVIGIPLLD